MTNLHNIMYNNFVERNISSRDFFKYLSTANLFWLLYVLREQENFPGQINPIDKKET